MTTPGVASGSSRPSPTLPIIDQLPTLIQTLNDPNQRDDLKLKALQEISKEFEALSSTPQYPALLSNLVNAFLALLRDTAPQFIGENNTQQLRKLVLEMTQRMPAQELLKQFSKPLTSTLFRILQAENEENVLAALRILIELQKHFRPTFTPEITAFLAFCKSLYRDLQLHKAAIFEPRPPLRVSEIQELHIESALQTAFSVTPIQTEPTAERGGVVYTLLPRGTQSLKVLAELPIVVVLLYQIHRDRVQMDISDFIPLVLNTINLFPDDEQRAHPQFNRDLFVDFIAAQVKALSFLAFLARVFMETVTVHANQLVQGIVKLLQICPPEVAHLRRELLVATRHLMGSELRTKFIPYLTQLFDEGLMVGPGWTCNETLRPLVFSALADLVHHVRNQLEFPKLRGAVELFARCLHDPTLPGYVQAMCGKLMLNLVECIIKHTNEAPTRQLLQYMLEVFVRKFKSIRFQSLPPILEKYPLPGSKNGNGNGVPDKNGASSDAKPEANGAVKMETEESSSKDEEQTPETPKAKPFDFAAGQAGTGEMSVQDCRGLVRVLVCGAKTLSWGLNSTRPKGADGTALPAPSDPVQSRLFLRLLDHGLPALSIYTVVPSGNSYTRAAPTSTIRAKDEKETLEHFGSVYWMLPLGTLKEIMTTRIAEVVEAITENYALLSLPNSLLTNTATSTAFGAILLQHLLGKLPELGVVSDRANLYLKLFKLVFSSVSLVNSNDNEHMLKPHLHTLVQKSMELALSAREPSNYFLLLRALFRSIGGGSHDLLYQEFLPLLPSLLRILNSLQSGSHRQMMRELFVELCLTVPVRLSSLLPYLPLLMDPLVSALNGTPQLVQQGLRTLELCVDNLQPEFLYEHMAPVRAELMQALWRTLSSADENAATVALRILAKFGGSNRKMLLDPQRLDHRDTDARREARLLLRFRGDEALSAAVPVFPVLEAAVEYLHSLGASTEAHAQARLHSWRLIRAFLLSAFPPTPTPDLAERLRLALSAGPSPGAQRPKPVPPELREIYKNALCSMFFAVYAKDLRDEVIPFFNALMRSLTLQSLLEGLGSPDDPAEERGGEAWGLLAEGIAVALADPVKDFAHSAILALTLVSDTATAVLPGAEAAANSPLVAAIFEEVAGLCYESPWYARLGGCTGLNFMLANFPAPWILAHSPAILKAFLQVFVGLHNEISSGALDMASEGIGTLIDVMCKARKEQGGEGQEWPEGRLFLLQVVPHIASYNSPLRNQVETVIRSLGATLGWSTTSVVSLVRAEVEAEVLGALPGLSQSSISVQTGLLETLGFLCRLDPPFLPFSPAAGGPFPRLAEELMRVCEAEDSELLLRPSFQRKALATSGVAMKADLEELRAAAVAALASFCIACREEAEGRELREKMFLTVFKSLTHGPSRLQETAFKALQEAIIRLPSIDSTIMHTAMRPVLLNLSDYKNLSLKVAQRLLYLTRLAPRTFNEKLCQQLLVHLKKWLELVESGGGADPKPALTPLMTPEMETCGVIVWIIAEIPAATAALVEQIIPLIAQAERRLGIDVGSGWRPPLLRFLTRYPAETLQHFLSATSLDQPERSLLLWLLKQKDGEPFRQVFVSDPQLVVNLITGRGEEGGKVRELGLSISWILQKAQPDFLESHPPLLAALQELWKDPSFREEYARQDSMEPQKFKAPKTVIKTLLSYYRRHRGDLDLLFHLVDSLAPGRLIADFSALRTFLTTEIVEKSTVEWKREAFFNFLTWYKHSDTSKASLDQLSAILQYIIVPCITAAFNSGEGEALMGTPPVPEEEREENLVSRFVSGLIDDSKTSNRCLPDSLHILLYQLSCLFVHHAPKHIHDTASKKQGARLRKFMLFAWPCLHQNNTQDPTTKYYGHLLIANIIDNFAINRKIVLQIFQSLLKAHGQDPRGVIKQALTILTPAVPLRMDDGLQQLVQFAKDMVVKESHTPAQLIHLLNLIVRHYKVYYPVRHQLVQYLMNGAQKLVMQAGGTLENRRLAVDVWEMILKWELYRLKQVNDAKKAGIVLDPDCESLIQSPIKPTSTAPTTAPSSAAASRSQSPMDEATATQHSRPIDKLYVNQVVNYLVRMASQAPEQMSSASISSGSTSNAANIEALNKKSLQLLKVALKPDVWGYTAELKLPWVEKILSNLDTAGTSGNVHMCLDVITFLIGVLPGDLVVGTLKPIQRGIANCLSSSNTSVVRSMYNLLSRLLAHLRASDQSFEALEQLSLFLVKFLNETLATYEKTQSGNLTALYGAVTTLRAMCTAEPAYLDRFLPQFVKMLQKLTREHTNPMQSDVAKSSADMISLCLELIRPRLEAMSTELRKQLMTMVLVPLVEKSPQIRVLTSVLKMVGEWVGSVAAVPAPSPVSLETLHRDRHIILIKMMQSLERPRFAAMERQAESGELQREFLSTVLGLYKAAAMAGKGGGAQPSPSRASSRSLGEAVAKLEPAFHRGLAHSNAAIRGQFLGVWEAGIGPTPFARLTHILSGQNWEPMHHHYWIKQCIYLMLGSCEVDGPLSFSGEAPLGPGRWALPPLPPKLDGAEGMETDAEDQTRLQLAAILDKQNLLVQESAGLTLKSFLEPLSALCFADSALSEKLWVELVPALWRGFSDAQRASLGAHLVPFLVSGNHLPQKEAAASTLRAFVEALARLDPPVRLQPSLLKYLGRSHGLWHRSALLLEAALPAHPSQDSEDAAEVLGSLAALYETLEEWDLWAAVWARRARYPQTKTAIAFSQHGQFTQASEVLEQAMVRQQADLAGPGGGSVGLETLAELELWEAEWARCMGELNQWEVLADFAGQQAVKDPLQLLDTAWRVPNWPLMKDALASVERSCPADSVWLVHLYRGYLLVCGGADGAANTTVERCADLANRQLILRWRKLPKIVGPSHVPVLLAAQRVMELLEASQLVATINPSHHPQRASQSLHDIKAVVKTWRNRTPNVSDRLVHWYDIFFWRLHHYDTMFHAFQAMDSQQQQVLLPMHSCAQCLVQLARVARKHNQIRVSLDLLNRLHTMPSIPTMDIFMKLYQQVKTCIRVAELAERAGEAGDAVQEGLDILADTNVAYLNKDQTAKLYGLKGTLLSRLERVEDANRAFSAALQLQDSLNRVWGLWADHLLRLFAKDQRVDTAVHALTAAMQAARHEHENRARKHLSKVIWLVQAACSLHDSKAVFEALEKYAPLVQPLHWTPWVDELIGVLQRSGGLREVASVLRTLGKAAPQTLLLPLVNALGWDFFQAHWNAGEPSLPLENQEAWTNQAMETLKTIFVLHSPEITALLRVAKELECLGESWSQGALRTARAALSDCRREVFESRHELFAAQPSPQLAARVAALSDALKADDAQPVGRRLAAKIAPDASGERLALLRLMEELGEVDAALGGLGARLKPRRLLSELSEYLAAFSPLQASILLFGQLSNPKPVQYCVRVSRFLPDVELRDRPDGFCTKIFIRGHNGKKYGFILRRIADEGGAKKELRISRLLPLLNLPLQKDKETARRLMSFSPLSRVALTRRLHLCEDEPSTTFLAEILNKSGTSERALIRGYYERLASALGRGSALSHQLLLDLFKEMGNALCPKTTLKAALTAAYPNPTDYFIARKQMALHLSLISLAELVLELSWVGPGELALCVETGFVAPVGLAWDLEAQRPVPFRLTPNISAALASALAGTFTPAMVAAARALNQAQLGHLLRPFLWSELAEAGATAEEVLPRVLKALHSITTRLQKLATSEVAESQVGTQVAAAASPDNLCRMDPAWIPWF